ncbi:MAG: hypothetical protein JRI97_06045, partial [Deltaproteobacteria bacterium]|nr:hypothetical protein [Deltaproteobacteria bacterium]
MNDAELQAILTPLAELDPEAGREALRLLAGTGADQARAAAVAEDGVLAVSQEPGLGREVVQALCLLAPEVPGRRFAACRRLIRAACRRGPTLGAAMARGLAAAEPSGGPRLSARFLRAFHALEATGSHALKLPLEAFAALAAEDPDAAAAYLDLLAAVFSRRWHYHQTLKFIQRIPALAKSLPPARRGYQMQAMASVARREPDVVRPFMDGLEADLALLDQADLRSFARRGLDRAADSVEAGRRFFRLESAGAKELCASL